MFREIIKREFPLTSCDQDSNEASLSYLEKNSLLYAAVYVISTARKVEFHGIGLMTEIYSKCDILAMCLMS